MDLVLKLICYPTKMHQFKKKRKKSQKMWESPHNHVFVTVENRHISGFINL